MMNILLNTLVYGNHYLSTKAGCFYYSLQDVLQITAFKKEGEIKIFKFYTNNK